MFFWACGPGLFLKRVLFALRALFFPGPAARAFSPFGHFASGGELFARPKSSSKTAPSGGPAGPSPHSQPSWGFSPPRPSARVAGPRAKLGVCQQCHLKPPRKTPFTRNPLGASLLRAHQRGSRDAVQNMEGVSTALYIQPRVFDTRLSNSPYANFALPYVNPRVDRKQCRVDTPTTLHSRLLKAGGWLQKLLLTRLKFRTVSRDPR